MSHHEKQRGVSIYLLFTQINHVGGMQETPHGNENKSKKCTKHNCDAEQFDGHGITWIHFLIQFYPFMGILSTGILNPVELPDAKLLWCLHKYITLLYLHYVLCTVRCACSKAFTEVSQFFEIISHGIRMACGGFDRENLYEIKTNFLLNSRTERSVKLILHDSWLMTTKWCL